VVFQTEDGFLNVPKARVVSVDDDGGEYIDFRQMNARFLSGVSAVGAGSWQVLVDAPEIEWDVGRDNAAEVTLGGDRFLRNPRNLTSGATYHLVVKQDATGERGLSFGSAYRFPGGVVPALTVALGAVDLFEFLSDGHVLYATAFNNFG